ncbi:MAG: 5-oxoprolinase subunit PxpA [Bacteroidota bacterium]
MRVDLNMDVGEGANNEVELFPFISSCNIACGGHAGNHQTIECVIKLAQEHKVNIGAHPSFPDKRNFGRVVMDISNEDLKTSIIKQLELFKAIASDCCAVIHHVKAHGALYNLAAQDLNTAKTFLLAVKEVLVCPIYAPFNSMMADEAQRIGIGVIYEAFADRRYNDDLSLVSRSKPNALIQNPEEMLEQVKGLIKYSKVKTINGIFKDLRADTICIHSDTEGAEYLVHKLFDGLMASGIEVS